MNTEFPTLVTGQVACLTAALGWAIAVTLFRGPIESYGARTINLSKCLLAAALQGLTVLILGQATSLANADRWSLLLLGGSGVIGLVFGDTALFAAVARIGVQRTLLLQTLAPVFTVIIASVWLGEQMTGSMLIGGSLILAGIALVVAPRRAATSVNVKGKLTPGIALAVIAALGQALGIVMAKSGMESIPVLAASFFRLAMAGLGLLVIEAATGRLGRLRQLVKDRPALNRAIPATFVGTYLSLFLMMAGVAMAPAAMAAVLLSTPPIFSLFLEVFLKKRRLTTRDLVGTLVSIGGVYVLTAF
jgi:drug/metabolite transporter (DMT)-like permease